MRTVFVNPVHRGSRRRNPRRRRRNPFVMRNPGLGDLGGMARTTAMIAAGAVGGAILNRVGINSITNFYLRNGARVLAAGILSQLHSNQLVAIAAAGAALAPMVPEVEMQLSAATVKKNPEELAAELADLLEADLSDGDEVGDDEVADDEVGDEEVAW